MKNLRKILMGVVLVFGAAGGGYYWWLQSQNQLPDSIAAGNGRIEAEEIHVAAKYAGRVVEVLVNEFYDPGHHRKLEVGDITSAEKVSNT